MAHASYFMSIQVPWCAAIKNNLYTGEMPVRLAAFRRMHSADLSAACGEEAGMRFHSEGMKREEIGFTNLCYILLLFCDQGLYDIRTDYAGNSLQTQNLLANFFSLK